MESLTKPTPGSRFYRLSLWVKNALRKGRSGTDSSRSYQKILVIRPDEIGDAVMTTPLFRQLRQAYPDARIVLVVKTAAKNLFETCPYVDRVIDFNWSSKGRFGGMHRKARLVAFAARFLWKERFELAILPRWGADVYDSTYMALWSLASERLGYSSLSHVSQANSEVDTFLTRCVVAPDVQHEVERNLNLLKAVGVTADSGELELWLSKEDLQFARNVLAIKDTLNHWIALAPSGGNSPLKQWPLENWKALGRLIQEDKKTGIVLLGGPQDRADCERIKEFLTGPVVNLAGKASLRESAAVMQSCLAFIGNDTGLLHMAAAMKMRGIGILGPTCPHQFGPWGTSIKVLQVDLPCRVCQQGPHADRCTVCVFQAPECLTRIGANEVYKALLESLTQTVA